MFQRTNSKAGVSVMGFREDINGLRGWAVLIVILYHYNIAPFSGGFVGVDVFFVISGFLMTKIILTGVEKGNFSLWQFYMARVRRIIPALLGLCLSLLTFGFLCLPRFFLEKLESEIGNAVIFISNFHYYKLSNDYFATSTQENWLLHTWSLAVEWQFYFILPVIIIFCQKYLKNKENKVPWILPYSLIAILSFVLCAFLAYSDPTQNFYLLHTRMWEMLAGGVVFLLNAKKNHTTHSTLLYLFGWLLLAIGVLCFHKDTLWPSIFTLAPVLATSCIILSNKQNILTSNPILNWFGLRSYSIYLYHWPLAVILFFLGKDNVPSYQLGAIIIGLIFSEISYRVVEIPCRQKLKLYSIKKQGSLLGGTILLVIVLVIGVNEKLIVSPSYPPLLNGTINQSTLQYNKEVENRDPRRGKCSQKVKLSSPECVYGTADIGVILAGDSHAGATITALGEVAESFNKGAVLWAKAGTPTIFDLKKTRRPGSTSQMEFNNWIKNQINKYETNIPLVLLSRINTSLIGYNEPNRTTQPTAYFTKIPQGGEDWFYQEFETQLIKTVCHFRKDERPVYIVRPIPEMGLNVPLSNFRHRLSNSGNLPEDFQISRLDYEERNELIWQIQNNVAKQCGAQILDPTEYLCDEEKCYGSIRGHALYIDDDHLSEYGNKLLKPMFEKIFD